MKALLATLQTRQGEWWLALLQQRSAAFILHITGIFQTLPSLAILGLLIPLMGIGTLPAITALVIYALFPVLQNTITGLNQIDVHLLEAAHAFGMTRWERLKKFSLSRANWDRNQKFSFRCTGC